MDRFLPKKTFLTSVKSYPIILVNIFFKGLLTTSKAVVLTKVFRIRYNTRLAACKVGLVGRILINIYFQSHIKLN